MKLLVVNVLELESASFQSIVVRLRLIAGGSDEGTSWVLQSYLFSLATLLSYYGPNNDMTALYLR